MAQDSSQIADWRAWISRGVESFQQARYSEATAAFQTATDLNPASPVPHLYLGISWSQRFIPGAVGKDGRITRQTASSGLRFSLKS